MNLLEGMKEDYDLCINHPQEYQRKVDYISDLFSLKGRQGFKGDNCPSYVIGKYETSPFVMFGINPAYSSKNNHGLSLTCFILVESCKLGYQSHWQ